MDQLNTSYTVLIVDDNKDAANAIAKLLHLVGYKVSVAYSGADALSAVRAARPDAVLLDIRMPEMDGYTVAEEMRADQSLKNVVLVALTGFGQEEDKIRAKQAGFNHHLTKPASLADLRAIFDTYAR